MSRIWLSLFLLPLNAGSIVVEPASTATFEFTAPYLGQPLSAPGSLTWDTELAEFDPAQYQFPAMGVSGQGYTADVGAQPYIAGFDLATVELPVSSAGPFDFTIANYNTTPALFTLNPDYFGANPQSIAAPGPPADPPAVPEPATWMLALAAGGAGLHQAKKCK